MDRDRELLERLLIAGAIGATGCLGAVWLGRKVVKRISNSFIKRLMVDPYEENLWEFITAARKVGVQNIVETNLRAERGELLKRPIGSPKKYPDFDGIMFNFAQLHRLATDEGAPIDTKVVIGPQAQKPMIIDIPIIIAGMAYGFSLSAKAKIALAKGSALAGTATNTGQGPFLPQERQAAKKLIIQYNRGKWNKSKDILKQGGMIEIYIGQGATGATGHYISNKDIDYKVRSMMGLRPGEQGVIHANLRGIRERGHLASLVKYLREITGGVPIGVKMAASKYIEKDLEIAINAGIDFVTICGSKAGSKSSPPILQDDFGLPLIFALKRTTEYLQKQNMKDKISVLVTGGLVKPGDFLKALALGADAVYIGTVALFAMSHTQVLKALPWEPPPEIVFFNGKFEKQLSINKGAQHLANFLKSCNLEMIEGVRALGKKSTHDIDKGDLFALDKETAETMGLPLGSEEIPFN